MVAKQQEVIDRLRSTVRSTRLKAVREIKNQIIGNKNKKLSYVRLEAVPCVVQLLRETSDSYLLIQSAAAVGSFAYGLEDGVRAVVASGGVQHLLHAVSSQDDKVQEAALRALKHVWQVSAQIDSCLSLSKPHLLCYLRTTHSSALCDEQYYKANDVTFCSPQEQHSSINLMVTTSSASSPYWHQATRGPQRLLLKSWLNIANGPSQ